MKVFDVFVGNRKTNEIVHRKFIAKSADSIRIVMNIRKLIKLVFDGRN